MTTDRISLMSRKARTPAAVVVADAEPGTCTALIATTNRLDAQGEILLSDCFSDVVRGKRTPRVLVGHAWDTPPVGVVEELEEWLPGDPRLPSDYAPEAGALSAKIRFFLTSNAGTEAWASVRELSQVPGGQEWSVGMLVAPDDVETDPVSGIRYVRRIADLIEVSLALAGASPGTRTRTLASKSLDVVQDTWGPRWLRPGVKVPIEVLHALVAVEIEG